MLSYRISQLSTARRVLLILQAALALLGLGLYLFVGTQKALAFGDHALRVTKENGHIVYADEDYEKTGNGWKIVARKDTLEWYEDGLLTATYTVVSAPDAVPAEGVATWAMTKPDSLRGVAIYRDGQLMFRGGYRVTTSTLLCFSESGSPCFSDMSEGSFRPGNILCLLHGTEAETRGEFWPVLLGLFFCGLNAADILYAEDIFRWRMSWSLRYADDTEPSDWVYFGWYISWGVLSVTALALLLLGALGA